MIGTVRGVGDLRAGFVAGFVATVVLSILMMMKATLGLMPQLNPIKDIVAVADNFTGMELPLVVGWFGHFVIGVIVWGSIYALVESHLPGAPIVKGLVFALGAWLAMMIAFMPLAGQGFFGLAIGPVAAMMTLVLHLTMPRKGMLRIGAELFHPLPQHISSRPTTIAWGAGNVWDNAAMESFFSSLKTERTARKLYRTRDEAKADVFDYIERFYNPKRRHSTIGYLSPMEFESNVGLA